MNRLRKTSFLEQLMEKIKLPRQLGPHEIHVCNVRAKYGSYQIIIGPAEKQVGAPKGTEKRSIEINGALPHMYVSEHRIRLTPSKEQIEGHLKGCVVLQDLTVHLKDPMGDGKQIAPKEARSGIYCKEKINMAGEAGTKELEAMEKDGTLIRKTYQIIQKDILNTLRGNRNF